MIEYGKAPEVLGHYPLNPEEMMIYMYLPIKMTRKELEDTDKWCGNVRLPDRLYFLGDLINRAWMEARCRMNPFEFDENHYMYLTCKTMYVGPGYSGNRPGWHADGYGSNGDLNFIWYDMNPTEFAVQEFKDIPEDDYQSMVEMEKQIDPSKIVTYPAEHLLLLDESVVHRVNPVIKEGFRTFIKISVSRHRFNLKGNSHNYLFDYDWGLHDRQVERNLDNNKDYVK